MNTTQWLSSVLYTSTFLTWNPMRNRPLAPPLSFLLTLTHPLGTNFFLILASHCSINQTMAAIIFTKKALSTCSPISCLIMQAISLTVSQWCKTKKGLFNKAITIKGFSYELTLLYANFWKAFFARLGSKNSTRAVIPDGGNTSLATFPNGEKMFISSSLDVLKGRFFTNMTVLLLFAAGYI